MHLRWTSKGLCSAPSTGVTFENSSMKPAPQFSSRFPIERQCLQCNNWPCKIDRPKPPVFRLNRLPTFAFSKCNKKQTPFEKHTWPGWQRLESTKGADSRELLVLRIDVLPFLWHEIGIIIGSSSANHLDPGTSTTSSVKSYVRDSSIYDSSPWCPREIHHVWGSEKIICSEKIISSFWSSWQNKKHVFYY